MEENNATITPLPLEVDDKTNHPLDDTKVRSSRGDVPNKPITGPQGMDSPTHAMNTVTVNGTLVASNAVYPGAPGCLHNYCN